MARIAQSHSTSSPYLIRTSLRSPLISIPTADSGATSSAPNFGPGGSRGWPGPRRRMPAGESQVVLDPRAGPGLAARAEAVEDEGGEALRGAVDGRRQAGRPGRRRSPGRTARCGWVLRPSFCEIWRRRARGTQPRSGMITRGSSASLTGECSTNVFAARLSMSWKTYLTSLRARKSQSRWLSGEPSWPTTCTPRFASLCHRRQSSRSSVTTGNTWSARDAIGTMKNSSTTPWLTASSATLMARCGVISTVLESRCVSRTRPKNSSAAGSLTACSASAIATSVPSRSAAAISSHAASGDSAETVSNPRVPNSRRSSRTMPREIPGSRQATTISGRRAAADGVSSVDLERCSSAAKRPTSGSEALYGSRSPLRRLDLPVLRRRGRRPGCRAGSRS